MQVVRLRPYFTVGVLLICARTAWCTDPRLSPISAPVLEQSVRKTPLTSDEHYSLILRARLSGLAAVAYEKYTGLCNKHEKDAFSNLWRGLAALSYWKELRKDRSISRSKVNDVYQTIYPSLSKAYSLNRQPELIVREYGFFLWQYYGRMTEGLALVKKAVSLAPNDPLAHDRLGTIYSSHSGNAYNTQKAEQEFATAIRLDSSFADPHWELMVFYVHLKHYDAAKQQLQAYLALAPEQVRTRPEVKTFRDLLGKSAGENVPSPIGAVRAS